MMMLYHKPIPKKTCLGDQHCSLFRRGVNDEAFIQQRHLVGQEEEEKGSGSKCSHGGVPLLIAIAAPEPEPPGLGVLEKFGEVWLRLAATYRIKPVLHSSSITLPNSLYPPIREN
jgi:hypothetical protein